MVCFLKAQNSIGKGAKVAFRTTVFFTRVIFVVVDVVVAFVVTFQPRHAVWVRRNRGYLSSKHVVAHGSLASTAL